MRKFLLIPVSLAFFLASTAQAELYAGIKTGPMMVDIAGADDPTNISGVLGYELGVLVADLGIEAEISRTTSEGEAGGEDLEVDTNGLYVSLITPGPLYFKLRGGVVDTEVTIGGTSESDNNSSIGLGAGLSLGLLRIELEFTRVDDDVDYVTLGVQF